MRVNIFKNVVAAKPQETELDKIVYMMEFSQELCTRTQVYRQNLAWGHKKKVKNMKITRFPAFTPCAILFEGKTRQDVIGLTDLCFLDIDHIDKEKKIEELLNKLRNDKNVVLASRSVSGDGVHILIRYQLKDMETPPQRTTMAADEMQEYKNERSYFNLSIEKDNLRKILEDTDWYEFIIPRQHLEIDSMRKLENMNEFCLMALKAYVERFYKFEKERWEDQYLEYAELDATDNNFVDEYSLTLTEEAGGDYGKELENFINDATAILNSQNALDSYDSRQALAGNLVLFDFRYHLYAPLVCVKKSNLKIQVSPVSMNADEKLFVDHLEHYVNTYGDWLKDKSLYLLRNKSKVGMGFFEAGNFYPDYILWIDTPEVQYISFIDPKGLLHFTPQDDKIKFYLKIKELEARLAPSATDKKIVLNSFIMSATKAAQLKQWWHMTTEEYEALNVYTLDDSRCVEKMLEIIVSETGTSTPVI